MKTSAILLAALLLAPGFLSAQSSTVPLYINYQGKVTNSDGTPLGSTGTAPNFTAAPVNRKVLFRIWDDRTSTAPANRLWSEEQTVTIALGEFSVLLGLGINPTGFFAGETRGPLEAVFTTGTATLNGPARFLEILVENNTGAFDATDSPITPRQQITTTAYSFRARSADTIASGTDLQLNNSANYGLGWYGAGRLFGGTPVDGPVLYGNAGGALGSNIGGTQNLALRWTSTGQVGIGVAALQGANLTGTSTTTKLVLQGDDSLVPPLQLAIRGNTDINKRLLVGYNTTSNYGSLQAYSASSTASNLLLNPIGGNVGIGIASPLAKFSVTSPTNHPDGLAAFTSPAIGSNPSHIHWGATGDIYWRSASNSGRVILQDFNGGNVGIGTNDPLAKLDILAGADSTGIGDLRAIALQFNGGGYRHFIRSRHNATPGTGNAIDFFLNSSNTPGGSTSPGAGNTLAMSIDGGNISGGRFIGTTAKFGAGGSMSQYPLEVDGWFGVIPGVAGRFFDSNFDLTPTSGTTGSPVSIRASRMVQAGGFAAISDARIKNIRGQSDAAADLGILRGIEITDYVFKDAYGNGNGKQKKVVAQQVEKVYPQAVSQSVGVVPDIFQKAIIADGWVSLATSLQVGERVKLITEMEEGVHEVLEVKEGRFRTDFKPEGSKVFVYGREVKDFRTVDYEAISMLNVSATQELARKVEALEKEKAELKERLSVLEARDQARDAKLAAIEKLLRSADQPLARPASVKKAIGAE